MGGSGKIRELGSCLSSLLLAMPGGGHTLGSSGPEDSQRFSFLTRPKASSSRVERELLRDHPEKRAPFFSRGAWHTSLLVGMHPVQRSPFPVRAKSLQEPPEREQSPGQTPPSPRAFAGYCLTTPRTTSWCCGDPRINRSLAGDKGT